MVAVPLYLDTARLGRMSKRAQEAVFAFTRLVGEEPCSARFDDFLKRGIDTWSEEMRSRYQGLSDWRGISGFKDSLRSRLGASSHLPIFIASRTTTLMRLSARVLFCHAKRVLTTDLEWPAYREILQAEGKRSGRQVRELHLREGILTGRLSASEVVKHVVGCFREESFDGLFLSEVTYQGVRLPVREIVESLKERNPFVVIDGAQAFCHAPGDLGPNNFDLYLAGSHKWLRAYHPLGIGFLGREGSTDLIRNVLDEMMKQGELDDPLLHFTSKREEGVKEAFSETVSLTPLFACAAALAEDLERAPRPAERFSELFGSASELSALSKGTGWKPTPTDNSMRSGILLLKTKDSEAHSVNPEALRESFQARGVSLTAYEGGVIRLSARRRPLSGKEAGLMHRALVQCA